MLGAENSPLSTASDASTDHGLPALTPDIVEQEDGAKLDGIVPTRGYELPPVVGLGGSAGGLAALQTFFAQAPADSGIAFVVIMHLSSEHESMLADLLQRTTSMPVLQVQGLIKVEPNHVYVIPPAKHLSMADGHLHLSDPSRLPGRHVAVDLFFRTLADTQGPHAAAIVLSGADGDGAIGIKRIKERGGLTVAQEPREAEHESMPRAAIATGMVDWVLPVAEMPKRLLAYWHIEGRLRLPAEDGPQPARADAPPPNAQDPDEGERALHDILAFLRTRTGRDFTCYKRATILRRIGRRMQVNEIEDPQTYLHFLRTHPGEAGALLQDLLISVTNFFRDRDAFEALEAEVPRLFQGKGPLDAIRVWVAACATGEEAYSVAMLLCEHAGTLDHPPAIQVFATDLDENAIHTARDGVYPETIAADVSEERLRRFFSKEHGGYRIKRELREMVLFALHDLLKDSPFSRLDLVTCRNLLIYLNHDAQTRALEVFHFALGGRGLLFLGSSESVDEDSPLFAVTDKKHRLYVRRAATPSRIPSFAGSGTFARTLLQRASESPASLLVKAIPGGTAAASGPGPQATWSELHFRLM
jgi:two-component system CheB/CheR fusion protein